MLPLLLLQSLHACVCTVVYVVCSINAVDQSPMLVPHDSILCQRGCCTGLKAGSRQKAGLRKKPVGKRQKKKGKAATADLVDDVADAVLQNQQQVLGDLSQAMLHWSHLNAIFAA